MVAGGVRVCVVCEREESVSETYVIRAINAIKSDYNEVVYLYRPTLHRL